MIDFHAHVLPRCDHGSDGIETSLKQLRLAKEAGVQTVIATPHFYPDHDRFPEFLTRRERTYAALMEQHSGLPEVRVGCEVNLCPGLDHLEGIEQACVQGTKVILLEMPYEYWSSSLEETMLRFLEDSGLVPVLAHVDRYDPDRIEHLLRLGFLAQLNAECFSTLRGRRQKFDWIDRGSVVALGSDIHGVKPGYAEFTHALKVLKDRADVIFRRTEQLLEENRI